MKVKIVHIFYDSIHIRRRFNLYCVYWHVSRDDFEFSETIVLKCSENNCPEKFSKLHIKARVPDSLLNKVAAPFWRIPPGNCLFCYSCFHISKNFGERQEDTFFKKRSASMVSPASVIKFAKFITFCHICVCDLPVS